MCVRVCVCEICDCNRGNVTHSYGACFDFPLTLGLPDPWSFSQLTDNNLSKKNHLNVHHAAESPLVCMLTCKFKSKPLSNPSRTSESLETAPAILFPAKSKA